MAYRVIVKPSVAKVIRKSDRATQRRIVRLLGLLGENPRPEGVVKLQGDENLWRVRVGGYRVVYEIHDDRLVVLVLRVGHRGDVCRKGR